MHRAAQKEYRDKVLQGGSGETKKKKKQNAKQTITLSRYAKIRFCFLLMNSCAPDGIIICVLGMRYSTHL